MNLAGRGAAPASDAASDFPKALAAKLARIGIHAEADLVLHLPLRYEDETRVTPIADARPGEPAQIEGTVVGRRRSSTDRAASWWCRVRRRQRRHPAALSQLLSEPAEAACSRARRLRVFGEMRGGFLGDEMVHPRYHVVA